MPDSVAAFSPIQPERLLAWLQALNQHRVSPEEALTRNLENFLARASPLLRARDEQKTRGARRLTVESLRNFTAVVADPLASARTSGAHMNVWKVAGLGRNEVRTAAVLAWVLDPRGSHGRGARCLRALFAIAARYTSMWDLGDIDLMGVKVRTEFRPQASERDRVDIAIEGSDFVVFIEVKIDAALRDGQLTNYAESAAAMGKTRWRMIYLSPREAECPENTAYVTWRDIEKSLNNCINRHSNMTADLIIMQFQEHIRQFF